MGKAILLVSLRRGWGAFADANPLLLVLALFNKRGYGSKMPCIIGNQASLVSPHESHCLDHAHYCLTFYCLLPCIS
ncbi:MAG: hypothetical protein IJ268_04285, partial [Proteobacteria bacterium]|nr:hypothetical protein [Pseudomonadota bacterium]